jgi:hypothetical protein
MADEAKSLFEEGHEYLEVGDAKAALGSFSQAYDLYQSNGDDEGALQALVQVISMHHLTGESEHAKQMAYDKMLRFQTSANIDGEVCMLEQYLNICLDRREFADAEATAKLALERLATCRAKTGKDTTAAEAYMWLFLSGALLGGKEAELAAQAAKKASELFSGLGMHEQENQALDAERKANRGKGAVTQTACNKHDFYLGIRLAGISYGPKFRDNNIINVSKSGDACSAALQLTCATEEWEDAVAFHPGIIDAGAHISFVRAQAPDVLKAMEAAGPQEKEGPTIPYMMDKGTFTERRSSVDGYFTMSSGTQTIVFSH